MTRDQVAHAKPDPDLFLAAAERLGAPIETAYRRSATRSGTCSPPRAARALGIGLLSGGYGEEELQRASALRVYEDPADLLAHIYELAGGR